MFAFVLFEKFAAKVWKRIQISKGKGKNIILDFLGVIFHIVIAVNQEVAHNRIC